MVIFNFKILHFIIKSFALLPTYPTKYMHKAWESKTKTLRDIVVYHKRGETVLFTYLKKPLHVQVEKFHLHVDFT